MSAGPSRAHPGRVGSDGSIPQHGRDALVLPQLAIVDEHHASALSEHRRDHFVYRVIQYIRGSRIGDRIFQSHLLAEPRRLVVALLDNESLDPAETSLT